LLSLIATRVMAGLAIILAVWLPSLVNAGYFAGRAMIAQGGAGWLMPIYYSFLAPACIALLALDRILAAVRSGQVFTAKNVTYLRTISWCCFVAGAIMLASVLVSVIFLVLAILAAFFGLILRVVKNLFAAAVALQDESDYTI
jgi:hypothetical protein